MQNICCEDSVGEGEGEGEGEGGEGMDKTMWEYDQGEVGKSG